MRLFTAALSICAAGGIFAFDIGLIRLSPKQQAFADELVKRFADSKKSNIEVVASPDGWLFFAPELRLLSVGRFWGDLAATVAPSRKPNEADPAAAIVDFCNQLKKRGVGLVLVPVPPKAAIYPEKFIPAV